MDATLNATTVERFLQAINDRELGAAPQLITPGYVRHDYGGFFVEGRGPQGWAEPLRLLLQAMPDLRVEVQEVLATEDRAVAYLSVCGTHLGEFLGVPPTGRTVCFDSVDLYRLEGGQIAESWPMPDLAGIRRAFGAAA